MATRTRKLIIAGVIVAVLLLANTFVIATWLNDSGVIDWPLSFLKTPYALSTNNLRVDCFDVSATVFGL